MPGCRHAARSALVAGPHPHRGLASLCSEDLGQSAPGGQRSELWHHQGGTFDGLERAQISIQIAARTAGEGARRLAKGDLASHDAGDQLVRLLLGARLGQEENVPRLHTPSRRRLLLVAGQPVKQAHAHAQSGDRGRPVGRGDRSARRREQQCRGAREHRREPHRKGDRRRGYKWGNNARTLNLHYTVRFPQYPLSSPDPDRHYYTQYHPSPTQQLSRCGNTWYNTTLLPRVG